MEGSPSRSAIVDLTALTLVFLTSIPTFLRVFRRATSKARGNAPGEASKLYEDEDGVATEETQTGYTAVLPKCLVLSGCVLGFIASMGVAVYTTVHPRLGLYFENWLSVGIWVRNVVKIHCF